MDIKELEKGISTGDKRSLAKGITLVESTAPSHKANAEELLRLIANKTGGSYRIAISGIPGVGKSSFIEKFGTYLVNTGKKVAVLAIDPSSPISGGSIMGDKTRMPKLSILDRAFIRPSPTSGNLGGVARKTRESVLLCEAAGYDVCILETVGVGQSEYIAASMADAFLMLHMPATGDELQGIKKGILELTDLLVITKADGELENKAKISQKEHEAVFHLLSKKERWTPSVLTCSSLTGDGIAEVWTHLKKFRQYQQDQNHFEKKRDSQAIDWFEDELLNQLKEKIFQSDDYRKVFESALKDLNEKKITGAAAASRALKEILSS